MIVKILSSLTKNLIKQPFYKVYQQRLISETKSWKLPDHIGIILDGNRRYARNSGLPSILDGHALGAEKLTDVLNWCFELKISVVTIWIFSLDNFSREKTEVDGILDIIEKNTLAYIEKKDIHQNRVKVKFIGKRELLPESLREAIRKMEEATALYDQFYLNIAIAYGGREEITDACQHYLSDQAKKGLPLENILKGLTPENIDSYLYTSGLPDPDLIIRTSGEVRLSGFLLWQSAYSEYYFCDTYWPDFRKIDFLRAVRSFSHRKRRYGR